MQQQLSSEVAAVRDVECVVRVRRRTRVAAAAVKSQPGRGMNLAAAGTGIRSSTPLRPNRTSSQPATDRAIWEIAYVEAHQLETLYIPAGADGVGIELLLAAEERGDAGVCQVRCRQVTAETLQRLRPRRRTPDHWRIVQVTRSMNAAASHAATRTPIAGLRRGKP